MAEKAPSAVHKQKWFPFLDLALVLVAGGLWYAWPQLGWIPAVLPLAAWAIRAVEGGPLFHRTPLDTFFLLFLLTAGMGVWAAYDPDAAWAKFWLILDAVFLYYALAGQPHRNRWWIAGGAGTAAAALAVYFFLTHDWRVDPANIPALNQIGISWMRVRPELPTHILHSNVAAGLIAMLSPFLVAMAAYGRRIRDIRWMAAGVAGLVLAGLALLMSTSRGAWLGLGIGAAVWLLWKAIGYLGWRSGVPTHSIFLITLSIILVIGVAIVALFPNNLIVIFNTLPGPQNVGSRLDLVNADFALIGDFPFTGGGLASFSGLFSQYILVSPSHVLAHGHNLFLDVSIQQGLFGSMLLIIIIGQTIWMLMDAIIERGRKNSPTSYILWAALVGQITLVIHGLADDILYGSRAHLLLWVFSGIAASIQLASSPAPRAAPKRKRSRSGKRRLSAENRPPLLAFGITAALLLFYFYLFRDPLLATWQANLGAVRMAKEELAFFPTDEWDDGRNAEDLRPAAVLFEQAIANNPNNVTARHRLGEISMLLRDFPQAVQHLEIAKRNAPSHQGITKLLAYNYVWVDRYDDARQYLQNIPEARFEMNVYINWWRAQGRNDLSQKAATMVENLGTISNK